MEIPVLTDIVIILGLSIITILIFQKLKLPSLVGFLLAGLIAGPHALKLVSAIDEVEILSEIGVILLLFTIGLEFSIKGLRRIGKAVFLGGTIQMFLTTLVIYLVLFYSGMDPVQSFFIGFLLALSSTAIVLKIMKSKSEVDTPQGKSIIGILIFQDLIVVPMMLFVPILAGEHENFGQELVYLLLKVLLIICIVYLTSKFLVQNLLALIARSKSKELFIMSIIVICFAVTWLTSSLGLSMALGAFLAGLIIAESEFSYQAESNIMPFSEIFSAFFFVSIGMLLDLDFFTDHVIIILSLTIACIILKFLVASLSAIALKLSLRTVLITGLTLAQVGEFAFILSKVGLEFQLLSDITYQYFLSISILSMAASPFIIGSSEMISGKIRKLPFPKFIKRAVPFLFAKDRREEQRREYKDHLVIIGYGVNGRNVAKAAKSAGIPYLIIELNADTVIKESKNGEPIYYGDAVQDGVLLFAFTQNARVVVIGISDIVATRRIVSNIRKTSNTINIIVKTKYVHEMEELYQLGADEVIPEEFEASIEVFTRVLNKYIVPVDEIEHFSMKIRSGYYDMFRTPHYKTAEVKDIELNISDLGVAGIKVKNSRFSGIPFQDMELRKKYGISIIAIKRNSTVISDVGGESTLEQDDIVYTLGPPDKIKDFSRVLD